MWILYIRWQKKYKVICPKDEKDLSLLNGCFWAKAFRRELFSHIMLPEGYWYEDSILTHLIYPLATRIVTVCSCRYAYRSNPNGIAKSSIGKLKALDTIYITDLMLKIVQKEFGSCFMESRSYHGVLVEQFYLNQKRIYKLPQECQKIVFKCQSRIISLYSNSSYQVPFDRKLYVFACEQGYYRLAMLSLKLDPIFKALKIIKWE